MNFRTLVTVLTIGAISAASAWAQNADDIDVGALLRAQKYDEALEALTALTEREPENPRPFVQLGFTSHALGRYPEAVDAYSSAVALGAEDGSIFYNLACAQALSGNPDAAFHALDKALDHGFNQVPLLANDSDLESLRALPRFNAILARANELGGPCDQDPSYRRFDFWLGDWTVETATGQAAGTNSITRISEGCALLEQWVSANGVSGNSITYYDPAVDRWKQSWVGGGGDIMEFTEVDPDEREGGMRFTAPFVGPDGTPGTRRMTFTLQPDKRVRQLIELSTDEGDTWTVAFDGLYRRRAENAEGR